jgi:hypothetical protein
MSVMFRFSYQILCVSRIYSLRTARPSCRVPFDLFIQLAVLTAVHIFSTPLTLLLVPNNCSASCSHISSICLLTLVWGTRFHNHRVEKFYYSVIDRCRYLLFLMFFWPCIIVYQYTETNVMHFLFSLLRIKSVYMFRELLVRPQEALNKRQLVYCVLRARYVSWLYQVEPTDIKHMHCTKCRL